MLKRAAVHAIKALLEMAQDPSSWRSVQDLAAVQELPAPMLEQLLLQLRRAGLLEARRGRTGGYRLRRPAGVIAVAEILAAVAADPAATPSGVDGSGRGGETAEPPADLGSEEALVRLGIDATDRVTGALQTRLRRAVERELAQLTLEELLHDLRSTRAAMSEEGGLLLG
jgi:Rrf2 family protein